VVAFTPFLDEAASVADFVLPTHTALESWHAVVPATCVPSPAFAVSPPAVVPLLDTRDLIEILKAVADAVGGPMAAACPWTSSDMLVSEHVENLASLRRGGPYASVYETEWMLQLERGGWWSPAADSPEAIARAIVNAGGWADPFFEIGQITRRIQEQGGCSLPAPPVLRLPPLLPIPPNSLNPLRLEVFIPAAVNRIGSPNQPSLYELLGQPEAAPWGTWVEIGPETAERIGVTTGQRVQIASASNAMDVSVVVVEGMLPGVAALAFVPAVPTGGRWAREIVQDVRSIAPTNELLSGPIAVQLGSV